MSYLHSTLMRSQATKWLKDRIRTIKTSPDGAQRWLRDLGKNGYEHAQAVEEYAGKIIQESKAKLSPEEIYLLLHAIYTHDVGYRRDPETHPKHSQDLVTKSPAEFFIHDPSLAEAIGWLCAAHGLPDIGVVPDSFPVDILSRTIEFDLRFLGSLLMLADEMDQGYLRVFNTRGQENSPRNEVYHVEVGPQIVKIRAKPTSKQQYDELARIANNVQSRLDKVHDMTTRRGVLIEQVRLYPSMWIPHPEARPRPTQPCSHDAPILFVLDRTVLGMEILQDSKALSRPTVTLPTSTYALDGGKGALDGAYAAIVWVLGEDFTEPIPAEVLHAMALNTRAGGGLVLFPFVAWSVAQGINDVIEDAVPVVLRSRWSEGERQRITVFEKHPLSQDMHPFEIENTFEKLEVKPGCKCLIAADNGNPVLTVGTHGLGRVAYINISSHLCLEPRTMPSPWREEQVRDIVKRTIEWTVQRETEA